MVMNRASNLMISPQLLGHSVYNPSINSEAHNAVVYFGDQGLCNIFQDMILKRSLKRTKLTPTNIQVITRYTTKVKKCL